MRITQEHRVCWIGALFFLNLVTRGDGYFAFPRTMDPDVLRTIVLGHTLVLCATSAWLLAYLWRDDAPPARPVAPSAILALVLGSVVLITVLHVLQARRFAEAGYTTSYARLTLAVVASLVLLAVLWKASPVIAVVAAAMALKLYPLAVFPITAKRSDLLPIVDHALRSLWTGANLWQQYLLDNGVLTRNVRFPGVVVAYLPAFLLGVDLRFVLLASEVAFFALAHARWGRHPLFLPGCALLAFLPYWHVRHELYETPFWVVLLLVIFAIDRPVSPAMQIPLFALLLSFHQWGVLLAPLLLIYAARRSSPRRAVLVAAVASGLAAAVVWLASRGDVASFVESTFHYYAWMLREFTAARSFPPGSMSVTPWIALSLGAAAVRLLNASAQAGLVAVAAFTLTTLPRLFAFCAASLLLMNLTNVVAWTYQYLLVGALLWLGIMSKGEARALRHAASETT